eukprot:Phypoly_transcript_12610.p1 GENE.Phypoly_transcript_12610~~Phypoly_transcript_12610.p1  ORF type:complete len:318 (+),score=44.69 Phypoly_transcript_12610:112-1065(+)
MNKVPWLLCVIVVVAVVLPYCEGITLRKAINGLESSVAAVGEIQSKGVMSNWRHTDDENQKEGNRREGHHRGGNKEGYDGNREGHWEEHKGDGERHHKEGDGNDKGDGNKEGHHWDRKEGHHWGGHKGHWEHKEGHHWGGHKGGHHWGNKHMKEYFRNKYSNITVHFVENNLPPNVYVVLADKAIEVKALYETVGDTTAITKVGVRVADKNLIVSANENFELDGVQKSLKEFDTVEFENGSIKKERCGKLAVTYGAYQIFIKVHQSFEHEGEDASSDSTYIRLMVGVQKSAKVTPTGFVGARIAIDPASFISPESIV